ncbi:MAG: phospho-N-acetylmuramoyl-pentapeptide-transferase [Nitrospirota bacterium]
MLYHLLYPLHTYFSGFNVFRYITFRTAYAIITALILTLIIGPWMIRTLQRWQIGQRIREDGPKAHMKKSGTPTMGGVMLLIGIIVPTLLWADLTNLYVWLVIFSILSFGSIGFLDDYLKFIKKRSEGLKPRYKLGLQILAALIIAVILYHLPAYSTKLSVPFFKKILPDLGWFYIPFAIFVIVGASNAVNLTDGLDGLAIGPFIVAAFSYTIVTYIAGHLVFSEYLQLTYIAGSGELAVLCGAMIGAGLGFLWFNAYPASVFMGDIGSLPLGSALGTVAVISKHELLLLLVGGLFVIETLSVIFQVASFKLTQKRVFRMAPIHHHFELKGWDEPKIIVRFWIIAIVLALLSLSTLKLR